jgi:serine phosphatase RsbU (regulator of sigma subunit)
MHLITPSPVAPALAAVPSVFGFGHAGSCQSAMEVGGDFYDVWPLSDNALMLVVADVMGKGPAASLFAGTLRTLVHALVQPNLCPAQALTELNDLMFEQLSSAEVFITVQIAVADLKGRHLRIANAGHCPLIISTPYGKTRLVAPDGMPLGIRADATFSSESVSLDSFASVLMYTDGVTEARNNSGSFFGQTRLERWFEGALQKGSKADDLKGSLLRELFNFQGGRCASDDQTFLVLSDETPRPSELAAQDPSRWFLPWTYARRASRAARSCG